MNRNKRITFIDLFAGIGGFRFAGEQNEWECVFSSEFDKHACDTYEANFGERPAGDITKIQSNKIPDHDVLCGGFPCQAFSTAGNRLGFEDTRGTLIYEVARIVKDKRPKAFLLENVKGLLSHDKGKTFDVIRNLFGNSFNKALVKFPYVDNLGYNVYYRVLNAGEFGLAQNRERIFLVGFRSDIVRGIDFEWPMGHDRHIMIGDILDTNVDDDCYLTNKQVSKMVNRMFKYPIERSWLRPHFRIVGINDKSHTLVAMNNKGMFFCDFVHVDRLDKGLKIELNNKSKTAAKLCINKESMDIKEVLARLCNMDNVPDGFSNIRMYSVSECRKLQGFPDRFKAHLNKRMAYKQFGNAVAVPCVSAIMAEITKCL